MYAERNKLFIFIKYLVRTIKSESKSSGLAYKCFGIMLHWLNVAADLEQGLDYWLWFFAVLERVCN